MKVLKCRDVGLDCDFEIRAETEEEILKQATEHGRTVHNIEEISESIQAVLVSLIRDE
jgi:predicted small metal-binding protein